MRRWLTRRGGASRDVGLRSGDEGSNRLRVVADVVCVGRELEQTRLRRHLDAALGGVGGLVVIEGTAGVGKTTLANWCLAVATRSGGSVHEVGALGPELELPLGIWARIAASAAVAGLPVPHVLLDGAVEQLHPHARYRAVADLLQAMRPAPVVLIVDDLDRADESSLLLLAQLAPALPGTGVLSRCWTMRSTSSASDRRPARSTSPRSACASQPSPMRRPNSD